MKISFHSKGHKTENQRVNNIDVCATWEFMSQKTLQLYINLKRASNVPRDLLMTW